MNASAPCPPSAHGYRCGCQTCIRGRRRSNKRNRVRRQLGIQGRIDPAPTAEHIALLRAAGGNSTTIGAAAGVDPDTIRGIELGKRQTILATTADAILAIRAPSPGDIVDGLVTTRMLRALRADGHGNTELAEATGFAEEHISDLCHGRRQGVRRATAEIVADVYGRLSGTPGDSEQARRLAVRQGWPTPSQWGDEITNLEADPLEWIRLDRAPTVAEIVAEAEELYDEHGLSWEAAAARVGLSTNTLHTYRGRVRERAAAQAAVEAP